VIAGTVRLSIPPFVPRERSNNELSRQCTGVGLKV
jgi:hypothetical protein